MRTVATSPDSTDPITISTLGIRIAGGETLTVSDERGAWPDPTHLVQQARQHAEAAARERQRADRLAQALRDMGTAPDAI